MSSDIAMILHILQNQLPGAPPLAPPTPHDPSPLTPGSELQDSWPPPPEDSWLLEQQQQPADGKVGRTSTNCE